MGGCGRGSRRGADTPGRRRPCVSSTDGWAGATSSTGPPMSSADRSASPPSPVLRLVDGAVGWFAAVAAVDLGLFAALADAPDRSEEHTSELQSLMRISYAVFCLKKKNQTHNQIQPA